MDKSNDKQNEGRREAGYRCNPKQLELLLKCSKKKDMAEWNKWREENPDEEIWLQGANLAKAHLKDAVLEAAHLKGANLRFSHLEGANLRDAHLEGTDLRYSHLEGANLALARLEGADLHRAHLEGARLDDAQLKGANLRFAHLEGAELFRAYLEGADFTASILDGLTLFWQCSVDRKTDFRIVGLESCRIDEGTKYLLQYNKRRMNWEDWHEGESRKKWVGRMRQLLTCPVRLFWCLSDYG